ncbi:hypothetical protein D0T53_00290 [Dysgonomonas sp. 216]|uniref:Mov34/MPN/PAD-1 family protein n=1 Tax=Dysgonomonas sp. 216 TaxID=2302934 RepID=UPI0013D457F8|nr:Mov34/MPN/PAD-1 family protein [Dysgonomonas sp. 216]NDW17352.1 hypothetical protein [Dysgonomonas sp. 216]
MNNSCHTVVFSDKAYNAIVNESFRKEPLETGGILLGHILDNGIWIVMEVLPPGWNSVFQFAYFEYDEKFVNYLAQSVASEYKHELSLLGLWHRHPGSMDSFSGTDDETNAVFAGLNEKGAISGLVNIDPRFRLTMYHVSSPLKYDRVEVAVGNDLIPEEYFEWKHFPEKGLSPECEMQKNPIKKTLSNDYKAERVTIKTQSGVSESGLKTFVHPKALFALVAFLCLLLTFFLGYSDYKLKDKVSEFKVAYKLLGFGDIDITSAEKDSLIELYTISFDKEYKLPTLDDLIVTKRDSVLYDRYIDINMRGFIIDSIKARDSLNVLYLEKLSVDHKDKARKESIAKQLQAEKDNISVTKNNDYKRVVKYSILGVFVLFLLSILNVLFPTRWVYERMWLFTLMALFLSAGACAFIPELSYNGIVFFSSFYWGVFIFLLLSLIALQVVPAVIDWMEKKKQEAKDKELAGQQVKYWFQANPDLYKKEVQAIAYHFPDAEQSVDDGVLSFVVKYQTNILWHIQLAYDRHYNSKHGGLRAYIISPDLKDIVFKNRIDLPYINIDEVGEPYIDVTREMQEELISGVSALEGALTWINSFEKWNAGLIGLIEFKLR